MRKDYNFDDDGNLEQITIYLPEGHENESVGILRALEEDPEIKARVIQQREEFLKNRPKRRILSPC